MNLYHVYAQNVCGGKAFYVGGAYENMADAVNWIHILYNRDRDEHGRNEYYYFVKRREHKEQ